MPQLDSVFQQVALVLLLTAVIGVIARRLSQPLIIAFIVTGIAVGPYGLGVVTGQEEIGVLADIGIALLLFVVGLKLDLHLIRTVGPVALVAGLGQIAATAVIGLGLSLVLGLALVPALYVAIALTFSSTVVIVKLLSDRRELDHPYGRIAMGVLIVQDIVVVVVMIGLSAFGADSDRSLPLELARVVLTGAAFLALIVALMRWVLTPLLERLASTPELLVLFAVAWAVSLAGASDAVGFSEEVGAFLAGVSIASTPYRDPIGARLVSLRDFLLLFFFIDLGAHLDFGSTLDQLAPALLLSVFVLVGKPLIVLAITGLMGYRKQVGFRTAVVLAQISEFSLILAALGLDLEHITEADSGLITTVGLITISLSTYFILGIDGLYQRLEPRLSVFERAKTRDEGFEEIAEVPPPHVVVLGLGRYGARIVERLQAASVPVLGVDFDPEVLRRWRDQGLHTAYGDLEDPELPTVLPLEETRWVVSTSADVKANLALVHALRGDGYEGDIAAAVHDPDDAEVLQEAGVDLVLHPFSDAADHLVEELTLTDT